MRKLIIAATSILLLLACDKDYEGLQYSKMLQDSYGINGEGRIIPLTVERATELDGSVNFKGSYLYFASDRDRGNFDIYLRPLDDIVTVRITEHASKDYSPAISPDGDTLAFVSNREDPEGDIFVLDVNASDLVDEAIEKLENQETTEYKAENISMIETESGVLKSVKDSNPSWSPDSDYIAFSSKRGDGYTENIWICDDDGDNKEQLTEKGGMYPRFSPDGENIVFVSYRDKNSNGDIYIINIETKEEKRITSTTNIELTPTFTVTSNEIVYTVIDEDTNNNGKLDLKDHSYLMYYNMETEDSYPLTYSKNSAFSPRYFPVLPQVFSNEKFNFQGVIVFSEQKGKDINLNLIPEYGVIPKRPTASQQYELAEIYLNKYNDSVKYKEALKRVYYYFKNNRTVDSAFFSSLALRKCAVEYLREGNIQQAENVISFLKKDLNLSEDELEDEEIVQFKNTRDDLYNYNLNLINAIRNNNSVENFILRRYKNELVKEKKLSEDEKEEYVSIVPYFLDDLIGYYLTNNKQGKIEKYLQIIVKDYPEYIRKNFINFEYGKILYNKNIKNSSAGIFKKEVTFPKELEFLIKENYRVEDVYSFIISSIERNSSLNTPLKINSSFSEEDESEEDMDDDQNIIKLKNLIESFNNYSSALYLYGKADFDEAEKSFNETIKLSPKGTNLFYKSNVYLYNIYQRNGNIGKSISYLTAGVLSYNPIWDDSRFESYVSKLISYFETTGLKYENERRYAKAAKIYEQYTSLISYFKTNSSYEELYSEYGSRAHVLLIDTYFKQNYGNMSSIIEIEQKYLKGLNRARRTFDKAHIYGLAYIYVKKGLYIDYLYKINKLAQLENYDESDIPENMRKAVDHLKWSLFMDDQFNDGYLLKGWIYQYIDLRRDEDKKDDGNLYGKIDKYFPDYLLENNIDSYQRALEINDEKKNPEVEGNIHINIANSFYLLVNYPKALEHYKLAVKYKKSFSSKKEEAMLYFHLGYCYWQTGDLENSKKQIDRVYSIYKSLAVGKNERLYADRIVNILRYYALYERVDKNYSAAIEKYNGIIRYARNHNVELDFSRYYLEIAFCHFENGDNANALKYLKYSERILKNSSDDEPEYNLQLKVFGFGPFNIWNLGPDSSAFGETRIFAPLNNFQKKLLMYSLFESIYRNQRDYNSVIKYLKIKNEKLKEKDYSMANDLRIRTLNNLGYYNFLLRNYKVSEDYFREAWKLSEKEEAENLEGTFISIRNLSNLYCYMLENDINFFDNPEKYLNNLIEDVSDYRNSYKEKRLKLLLTEKEKEYEARNEEFTDEIKAEIEAIVEKEAADIYFKIDISLAHLKYYRAELALDYKLQTSRPDEDEILKENSRLFNTYVECAKVYKSAVDEFSSKLSNEARIRILLNAARTSERITEYGKSLEYFAAAEKEAAKYRMDEILLEVYSKKAMFLMRNYAKMNLDSNSPAADFSKAVSLIEKFPPAYFVIADKISSLYMNFAQFLLQSGNNKSGLDMIQRAENYKVLATAFYDTPNFQAEEDKKTFTNYKRLVKDFSDVSEKIISMTQAGTPEKSDPFIKVTSDYQNIIKNYNSLVSRDDRLSDFIYLKKANFKEGYSYYTFQRVGENIYLYNISNEVSDGYMVEAGEDVDVNIAMNDLITQKISDKYKNVLLINDFTLKNFKILETSKLKLNIVFSLTRDFPDSSEPFIGNHIYLTKNIEEMKTEDRKNLIKYSVITDNDTSPLKISKMMSDGSLQPSVLFKRVLPSAKFSDVLYLYYSGIYSGTDMIVFYSSEDDVPEDSDFPSFEIENPTVDNINSYFNKDGKYFAFGKNIPVLKIKTFDKDQTKNLKERFFTNMYSSQYRKARLYLRRWYDSVSEENRIYGQYEYYSALISEREGEFEAAFEIIDNVKLSNIEKNDLRNEVASFKIYLHLSKGELDDAAKLNEDFIEVTEKSDFAYYAALITALKNGTGNVKPVSQTYYEKDKINLLSYKLLLPISENRDFLNRLSRSGEKYFNDNDKLFVNYYLKNQKYNIFSDKANGELSSSIFENKSTDDQFVFDNESFSEADLIRLLVLRDYYYAGFMYDQYSSLLGSINFKILSENSSFLLTSILVHEIQSYYYFNSKPDELSKLTDAVKDIKSLKNSYAVPKLYYYSTLLQLRNEDLKKFDDYLDDFEDSVNENHKLYRNFLELDALRNVYFKNFGRIESFVNSYDIEKSDYKANIYLFKALALRDSLINADVQSAELIRKQIEKYLNASFQAADFSNKNGVDNFLTEAALELLKIMEVYYSSSENYEKAFKYSEISKQLMFCSKYPSAEFNPINFESEEEYVEYLGRDSKNLYSTPAAYFPLEKFQKKINKSSAVVSFQRYEENIVLYVIKRENIEVIAIENGFAKYAEIMDLYESVVLSNQPAGQVSFQLGELFQELTEKLKGIETLYIVHDKYVRNLPYELIGSDDVYLRDFKMYYLPSMLSTFSKPNSFSKNLSIADEDSVFQNIERIALKESGIRIGNSKTGNVHYQSNIIYDRMKYRMSSKNISMIGNKYLMTYSLSNIFSEEILLNYSIFNGVNNILFISPVRKDINTAYFSGKFYYNYNKTGDLKDSYLKAVLSMYENPKYRHPVYWEGIRLYVTDLW